MTKPRGGHGRKFRGVFSAEDNNYTYKPLSTQKHMYLKAHRPFPAAAHSFSTQIVSILNKYSQLPDSTIYGACVLNPTPRFLGQHLQ